MKLVDDHSIVGLIVTFPTVSRAFKDRLLLSGGLNTIFTWFYGLLSDGPWPQDVSGRAYPNRLAREWQGRDAGVLRCREKLASEVTASVCRAAEDILQTCRPNFSACWSVTAADCSRPQLRCVMLPVIATVTGAGQSHLPRLQSTYRLCRVPF